MIKQSFVEFESFYECQVRNSFLVHDMKSASIAVVFPGRGYTCEMPLLYYASMAALSKGCDVLSLEYGFYKSNKKFAYDDFDKAAKEIAFIINKCNLDSYTNIYFISKSLGTLFAGEVSAQLSSYTIKNLFLTPIEKTIPYMIRRNCIAVTGSIDKAFPASCIDYVRSNSKSEIVIIDEADHSLEAEFNIHRNMEILQQVIKLCEDFVS